MSILGGYTRKDDEMDINCPYCRINTAGQHEFGCPNYESGIQIRLGPLADIGTDIGIQVERRRTLRLIYQALSDYRLLDEACRALHALRTKIESGEDGHIGSEH